MKNRRVVLWIACGVLVLALAAGWILLLTRGNGGNVPEGGITLLLDGAEMMNPVLNPEDGDGLYFTVFSQILVVIDF